MSKSKSQGIWVAVNKNGIMRMFTDEPKRNKSTGLWVSKHPYVNSILYKEFNSLIEKSKITWESEPNYFEIQMENI